MEGSWADIAKYTRQKFAKEVVIYTQEDEPQDFQLEIRELKKALREMVKRARAVEDFMKKYAILAVLSMFLFFGTADAGTGSLKFGWQQTLPSPNDMKEWRLYKSTTPNVQVIPANLFATIPFVSAQTDYTSTQPLTSPDSQRVQYFFVLTAVDTSGNASGKSNEVNAWVDFQAPGVPINVTLTVTVDTP